MLCLGYLFCIFAENLFMQHWTKDQLTILKSDFKNTELNELAIKIGKPASAVKAQARKMKLFVDMSSCLKHKKAPIEKAIYLSGHFDGEGCVRFRTKSKDRSLKAPSLTVQIADLKTLELYKEIFGGSILKLKTFIKKPLFKWYTHSMSEIYFFVCSTIPFSIEKKEQMVLIKKWIELRVKYSKTRSIPNEFIELTNKMHEECTLLKK